MITKIVFILVALLEVFLFKTWVVCQNFYDKLQFSSFDAGLKLLEAINNDVGFNTIVVRFFHNKAIIYASEISNKYILFWDIKFHALLLSLVGVLGTIYGIWYLLHVKKQKFNLVLFVIFLILPFFVIFQNPIPHLMKVILITVPLYMLSLFGIWQFMKTYKHKGVIIVSLLLVLSIWYWMVFQKAIEMYC